MAGVLHSLPFSTSAGLCGELGSARDSSKRWVGSSSLFIPLRGPWQPGSRHRGREPAHCHCPKPIPVPCITWLEWSLWSFSSSLPLVKLETVAAVEGRGGKRGEGRVPEYRREGRGNWEGEGRFLPDWVTKSSTDAPSVGYAHLLGEGKLEGGCVVTPSVEVTAFIFPLYKNLNLPMHVSIPRYTLKVCEVPLLLQQWYTMPWINWHGTQEPEVWISEPLLVDAPLH